MHSLGQLLNKNSTLPKVSKTHQSDAQIADRQRKLEWVKVVDTEVEDLEGDLDNPLPLPAQIVASKIQFRSSRKAIDRFCVEIASATNARKHNLSFRT